MRRVLMNLGPAAGRVCLLELRERTCGKLGDTGPRDDPTLDFLIGIGGGSFVFFDKRGPDAYAEAIEFLIEAQLDAARAL